VIHLVTSGCGVRIVLDDQSAETLGQESAALPAEPAAREGSGARRRWIGGLVVLTVLGLLFVLPWWVLLASGTG
jgi:ferric-dicitrate binding protein FerR (iron transport regulator)